MRYLTLLLRFFYPKYIWKIKTIEKKVYLTFDDGPTPEITQWVLEQLEKYNAKATFFCIGDNIKKHPSEFEKIIKSDHSIGNHTFNHLNGWKTTTEAYLNNIEKCNEELKKHKVQTHLFRPPYGKIKSAQANKILKQANSIIMWDVISRDYDSNTTKEACTNKVLKETKPGSIVVMHDSIKAFSNLKYALPIVLTKLSEKGYTFEKLG